MKTTDQCQPVSPTEDLWRERTLLQAEYDLLINERAIDIYVKSRQQYSEHGKRACKLLSHQLKQTVAASYISAVRDKEGNIITDKMGINNQFKKFYE